MPVLQSQLIITPSTTGIAFQNDVVQNALYSLMLLNSCDHYSEADEWVSRSAERLSTDDRDKIHLLMMGFYYAFSPGRSWPSFSAFIAELEAQTPDAMRATLLDNYMSIPLKESGVVDTVDHQQLIDSFDSYLRFLQDRFHPVGIDTSVERRVHAMLQNPTEMQSFIVSTLRYLWDHLLAEEFSRESGMLEACVRAWRRVDVSDLSASEVVQLITGDLLDEPLAEKLDGAERVILVPSPHLGPYYGKLHEGNTFWFLFGARLPHGIDTTSAELRRSDMLVRLRALADDTRLQIIELLVSAGEMCSPEIMEQLDLSQSAASRHLKQLSAAGYLAERRRETAKCYALNHERIEESVQALRNFFR